MAQSERSSITEYFRNLKALCSAELPPPAKTLKRGKIRKLRTKGGLCRSAIFRWVGR